MLIVDDLLMFPARGALFIFREIQKAADAERTDSRPVIHELQTLYMRLETGQITEEEFARQESALLDRLDQTKGGGEPA